MKAIQIHEPGDVSKLSVADLFISDPKAHEVQVRVSYAGVNFMDVGTRQGVLKGIVPMPLVLGVEGSGVITKMGAEVKDFKLGDRVAWVFAWGSYAELINVKEDSLVKLPEGIDDQTGAAVMMQGITASHFATQFYETKPADIAFVNAAAGGVGLILTQITKIRGGKVVGRVSSESKVQAAGDAGTDYVIVAKENFAQEVMKITEGRGADVVYDGSGPTTFEASAKSLKPCGVFCWYGPVLGGSAIDLMSLPNSIKIGYARFSDHVPTPQDLRKVSSRLFDWIKEEKLKIKIHKTYSLADAAKAHQDMESRKTEGKLLLKP
jgi:NADPH2:quinone reductase